MSIMYGNLIGVLAPSPIDRWFELRLVFVASPLRTHD